MERVLIPVGVWRWRGIWEGMLINDGLGTMGVEPKGLESWKYSCKRQDQSPQYDVCVYRLEGTHV